MKTKEETNIISVSKEQIRALLSSEDVLNSVMNNLDCIVNDDMINGCTLVAEMEYPYKNRMQLQVRITAGSHNFFSNYHNDKPEFIVEKSLSLTKKP